jgi:ParB/RepB/Spo0J family partition protein
MTTTAEAPAARSPANSTPKRYFAHIPTREISDFPFNYRMDFNTLAIAELSESIQKQGLIEPIIVLRQEGADRVGTVNGKVENWKHRYIGIAGERRWRAVQLAEMDEIPAIVYEGLTDQQALEIALVENLQRQDVNPIEEANGYRMLKDRAHLKQNQIAERVGRPRSTVANTMRLLDLPQSVQEHISQGRLTKAHGIALLRFRGYDQVLGRMAELALEEDVPAGDLEQGVPFRYDLKKDGLLLFWDAWQLMEWGEVVADDELRACREEDKRVGWFRSGNEGYVCLNVQREEEINRRIEEAKETYRKKRSAEDAARDKRIKENGGVDPDMTEEEREQSARWVEQRKAREEEERKREELGKELKQRFVSWQARYDDPKKGPTSASSFREFDGLVKAVLWAAHDGVMDLAWGLPDDVKEYFFGSSAWPEEWEDQVTQLFTLPAHQLLELLARCHPVAQGDRAYYDGSDENFIRLLEGKKLKEAEED